MKSVVQSFLLLVCWLTILPLTGQDMLDLTYFTNLKSTKSLKLNSDVKSVEQFTCSTGSTPDNRKDCREREYHEFDLLHRITLKVDSYKDSMVYTYSPGRAKLIHYNKDKTISSTVLYTLKENGLIETQTSLFRQGTRKLILTYNHHGNLLGLIEYSSEDKVTGSLTITYDTLGDPVIMRTSDGGTTNNTFADKRLIKSVTPQFTYILAYDKKGNLIEKKQYSVGKCVGQTNYQYDKFGNMIEYVLKDNCSTGSESTLKITNSYRYDKHGNWIKMTSQVDSSVSDTYRVIEYYHHTKKRRK